MTRSRAAGVMVVTVLIFGVCVWLILAAMLARDTFLSIDYDEPVECRSLVDDVRYRAAPNEYQSSPGTTPEHEAYLASTDTCVDDRASHLTQIVFTIGIGGFVTMLGVVATVAAFFYVPLQLMGARLHELEARVESSQSSAPSHN